MLLRPLGPRPTQVVRPHRKRATHKVLPDKIPFPILPGMRLGFCAALVSIGLLSFAEVDAAAASATLGPLPYRAITLERGFWRDRLEICRQNTLPHSWHYLAWELRALEKANGREVVGELNGTWGEANLHKFLETVGYALAFRADPALQARTESVIRLLAGAQQPDGYLHAFVTNSKKQPWDPDFLDGSHDGYVLGHLIQAALAWQAGTGETNLLQIACRAADQAYQHFLGPNGQPGFCGHAGLEMALIELHRVVPKPEYLDLAKAFIEWRGRQKVTPFSETPRAYFQDAVPLREQKTLEGHAVRAVFFATGVADVALATGDADYRLAANRFWDSTARRRMTVVGSVGPRKEHEAFGEDYELPNDGYYESCAACGLADFAERMFQLEKRAEAADVLERVLYNAVLHGLSLDGTNSYYMNPLSDRDNLRYNSWVCCPPNLSRTLFKVPRYAFATDAQEVFVNLYLAGTGEIAVAGGHVRLTVSTAYPWDGNVRLTITPDIPRAFALNLRLPSWCPAAHLTLNGTTVDPLPKTDSGYLRLAREWATNDQLNLCLEMPVTRLEAHPNLRDCSGKIALQRGPLVYAFESLDNQGTATVELPAHPRFEVEHRPDLLGGVTVIRVFGPDSRPHVAIPFYALANRGKAAQEVWVRQAGFTPSTQWWLGELYRPYQPELPKKP